MLATIPVLLGNEFDVNVGLKKKRSVEDDGDIASSVFPNRRICARKAYQKLKRYVFEIRVKIKL